MSLVISLGTNMGDKIQNLTQAETALSKHFTLIEKSRIYTSKAVDYLNQPDFYNQVLSFELPDKNPIEVLDILLCIEKEMGRKRDIPKGPRVIDLDLLFFATEKIDLPNLQVPHPRLFERSFIVFPLKELMVYNTLCNHFQFHDAFCNDAFPLTNV